MIVIGLRDGAAACGWGCICFGVAVPGSELVESVVEVDDEVGFVSLLYVAEGFIFNVAFDVAVAHDTRFSSGGVIERVADGEQEVGRLTCRDR